MRLQDKAHHGITMAETVVSTLIIGFVLVGTLQITGPMVRSTSVHANRLVASNLANELMEEIITKKFTDPDSDVGDFIGLDSGERSTVRADYDDIDDYNGWSASPPKLSSSQANIFLSGWTRSVEVVHVLVDDPSVESVSKTGLKKIKVTVSKDGTVLASLVSLQSSAADAIGFAAVGGG